MWHKSLINKLHIPPSRTANIWSPSVPTVVLQEVRRLRAPMRATSVLLNVLNHGPRNTIFAVFHTFFELRSVMILCLKFVGNYFLKWPQNKPIKLWLKLECLVSLYKNYLIFLFIGNQLKTLEWQKWWAKRGICAHKIHAFLWALLTLISACLFWFSKR